MERKEEDPTMEIETDASLLGWGAQSGGVATGGLWSTQERASAHINLLERCFCDEGICREPVACSHSAEDGQPHSSGLYQPQRRHQIPSLSQLCKAALGVVSGERHYTLSGISPRLNEHHCRQGVPNIALLRRVEAGSKDVCSPGQKMGLARCRSVCLTSQQPANPLCQLETGPLCHRLRSFLWDL